MVEIEVRCPRCGNWLVPNHSGRKVCSVCNWPDPAEPKPDNSVVHPAFVAPMDAPKCSSCHNVMVWHGDGYVCHTCYVFL